MALPGASKLTEEQVWEIKDLFKNPQLKDKNIAEMYNVSRIHINHIRNGRRWNTSTRSYVSRKEMDYMRPSYVVPMLLSLTKRDKNFYDYLCEGITNLWKKITK